MRAPLAATVIVQQIIFLITHIVNLIGQGRSILAILSNNCFIVGQKCSGFKTFHNAANNQTNQLVN